MVDVSQLPEQAVAVFDVLRATTSMTAAASNGAHVRLFDGFEKLREEAAAAEQKPLLAGEKDGITPDDFDLGNSPAAFAAPAVSGKSIYMATTNGTIALHACSASQHLLAGAIVSASATAAALCTTGLPITLVCAGTAGHVSIEDTLGCGAAISKIPDADCANDEALLALSAWQQVTDPAKRIERMRLGRGGRNVIRLGVEADIDFAAQLDRFDFTVAVRHIGGQLVASRLGD